MPFPVFDALNLGLINAPAETVNLCLFLIKEKAGVSLQNIFPPVTSEEKFQPLSIGFKWTFTTIWAEDAYLIGGTS